MLNTTIRALLYITIIHGWLGVGAESSHQKEYMEAAGRSRKLQQANDTEMVEVCRASSTLNQGMTFHRDDPCRLLPGLLPCKFPLSWMMCQTKSFMHA